MHTNAKLHTMTGPFLVYTVLLLLGSVKAGISSYGIPLGAISCVKCSDDGCLNATKGWRSQNGEDYIVWDRNGLGNSIPVCKFFSLPSGTWYHVCQKNHTVFMVTNDSEAGVSFTLEASGKDLKSERKTGNECPTLEPEPPTTGSALECCSVGRDGTLCATVPCSHAPGLPWLSPVCLTCLIILICSS